MKCKTPRKGPRRRAAKPTQEDNELSELTAVLAEYSLDNNAHGWFRMPWRDGWNAVMLAYNAPSVAKPSAEIADFVVNAYLRRETSSWLYHEADTYLHTSTEANRHQRAALRCLQVLIAKSDGGGHVYNDILIPAFLNCEPSWVSEAILNWRCQDSIGVSPMMTGDSNDRLRRAFKIAWDRGLYAAAYSLPPAVVRDFKVIK